MPCVCQPLGVNYCRKSKLLTSHIFLPGAPPSFLPPYFPSTILFSYQSWHCSSHNPFHKIPTLLPNNMKPLMSECEYSEFQDDGGTDLEKPSKPPLCTHKTCDTMGTMTTKLSDRMFSLESRFSKLESVQASQAQQIAHLKLLSEMFSLKVLVANLITDRVRIYHGIQSLGPGVLDTNQYLRPRTCRTFRGNIMIRASVRTSSLMMLI